MPDPRYEGQEILEAIRKVAGDLGHPPSRREFEARAGIREYQVLKHFPSWREAVRAAGLEADASNVRLSDEELLIDWGELVRRRRQIPTRTEYRRLGKYSPGVFERHFGPWSSIPLKFRERASRRPEWADVVPLLPLPKIVSPSVSSPSADATPATIAPPRPKYSRLGDRPTYGDPMDFRGLRHEPVNEQGVVFLFGMVARELGYLVEAVQSGFPDCEAKRQVEAGKWQRVRIEFEFESRTFRDHGHQPEGCDVIVCWRHNWEECPPNLEVVELKSVIASLARSEE